MSRRLRIYGKSRLRSSEIEEEERQMLFRDWLMKERSRQFEIDVILYSDLEDREVEQREVQRGIHQNRNVGLPRQPSVEAPGKEPITDANSLTAL